MSKNLNLKRQKILREILPSLKDVIRGSLMKYYLPCGKAYCRCKKGFLHGPYYYLQVKTKGKNKMYYLSGAEMGKKAKEGIARYNKLWSLLCKISEINIRILREKRK